jgi:hypothetical protein
MYHAYLGGAIAAYAELPSDTEESQPVVEYQCHLCHRLKGCIRYRR